MSDSPDDRQVPPSDDADVQEADWVEVEWLDDIGDSGFFGSDDLDDDDLLEDSDGETVVFTYDATVRPTPRPSTSPSPASSRSGTSPADCGGARSRRTT